MDELKNIFLHVVRDNYANFDGRARRREFWMFFLCVLLINIALSVVGLLLGLIASVLGTIVSIISVLVSLGLLIPNIAVGVRRLHDTNKSGWFMLLLLVPVIQLVMIYFWAIEGDKGANEYGPDPKA